MTPLRRLILAFATLALTLPAMADPARWQAEWPNTDFARASVAFSEIMSGGPPKDGIPAIDAPRFLAAADETRLSPREPVMTYAPEGAPARAYPLRYLMWHEIVNDVVAGQPIAVTFCPLCNTGMVFDARVDGTALTFGVSGKLRHSDMIMYDRQTESWWQQATANSIVGQMQGARLTQLPAWMESWDSFLAAYPDGLVMDEPPAPRRYGANPYAAYDTSDRPFMYRGEDPPHGIHPLARVVRVGDRAWPLERLRAAGELREGGMVLTWRAGQASALDTREIGAGREVGNVRVSDARGRPVAHDIPFAFAFHAFHPNGRWMVAP
ncbi:MAG: Protein of unknown function (DUF3179) [Roseibaca calidilacus]|uniref:DUF3179 domain-containing protein n=1 Tax=Roseibaca calidilacus TaxID=1666912 RepID=A0A0P7W8S9_9RHOB|nr:DUF3179 domain-containing protein [Roseibaca calidilacus]KPP93587.1 MAG: Protein of unknown function (DUF3179) [Roseibaca calidilacus]CUX80406.1 Protein of unknown function (DUF3179) [Roseibaca calidilacus]